MKGKIKKGNNKGAGFLVFGCTPGVYLNILIHHPNVSFFAKCCRYGKYSGVYIPASLNQEIKDDEIDFEITELNGMPITFGSDGRFYVPFDFILAKKLNTIKLARFKFLIDGKQLEILLRFCKRKKKGHNHHEYYSFLNKSYGEKKGILLDILPLPPEELRNTIPIGKKPMRYNRPALNWELAYYLGCYFSDGTKKGTWAICASTLDQARFYLKLHRTIIPNPNIRFTVSYTSLPHTPWNENEIKRQWDGIPVSKIYIRKGVTSSVTKRNPFGTLIMKENNMGVLLAYKNILENYTDEILSSENSELAISFIGGVMEGDGGSNATKRGHIQIATNRDDCKELEKMLKVAKLKFKTTCEGKNRYHLRVGSEEITKNLGRLKLFLFYPKRRKTLIQRLSNTGIWRALIRNAYSGKSLYLLKRMGLLLKTKKPTPKGLAIRKLVLQMTTEVYPYTLAKSVTVK